MTLLSEGGASVLQPETVAGQALDGVEVFEVEEHVGEGCGGKACLVGYLVGTEGVGGAECIDYQLLERLVGGEELWLDRRGGGLPLEQAHNVGRGGDEFGLAVGYETVAALGGGVGGAAGHCHDGAAVAAGYAGCDKGAAMVGALNNHGRARCR